jgi:uncharacterized OsmC-like protein
MLAAAVGNCLAASFAYCLRRARIEPARLTALVTTHTVRNERGRLRIENIDVEIAPLLPADGAGRRRCEELFQDFCTVTASIRRGIPITVSLADAAASAA